MMDRIRDQREELHMLERKAEVANRRKEAADTMAQRVEEETEEMKYDLMDLRTTRNDLEIEIEARRLSSQLGPLARQISDRKYQLDEIENKIFSKERELIDQRTKLEDLNQKKPKV